MVKDGFKIEINLEEFVKKNKELERIFSREVEGALRATSIVVDRELKESVQKPKKGTISEIRRSRNGNRYRIAVDKIKRRQKPQPYRIIRRRHRAGAKGEPIAVDTGSYLRSIRIFNQGKVKKIKNGFEVQIVTGGKEGVNYARAVEKRNPTMRPAFKKGKRYIKRTLQMRLRKIFR